VILPAAPEKSRQATESQRETAASSTPAVAIPLIVWLLIQFAAIALAASRVSLSANYPRPAQSLAVHVVLVAQFVGSAVFLPVLFRGWRALAVMIVTAGLMLVLGSTMTGVPLGRVMVLWGHVALWLAALATWRAAIPRASGAIAAVAIFLTAGGHLLAYLHAEFQPATVAGWLESLPLLAAIGSIADSAHADSPFPSTSAGLVACGLVILAIMRAKRREIARSAVSLL
jgi:hypothetical protein